ncbi:hypothetical protein BH10BAC5_BH10BAC5_21350 [soil metagenome]
MKLITNNKRYLKIVNACLMILTAGIFTFTSYSCNVLNTLSDIQRLQFKLGQVNGFNLAGVSLASFSSASSINPLDIVRLTSAFANGSLPAGFTLNVITRNPNGSNGSTSQNNSSTIRRFQWKLLINDAETVSGTVNREIVVPGMGHESVIPVDINIDLMQFFRNQGFQNLMNLALNLGGANRTTSNLKMVANVDVNVLGVTIPINNITIVDRDFR